MHQWPSSNPDPRRSWKRLSPVLAEFPLREIHVYIRTHFPVGHGPRVRHPVGDVGAHGPRPLRGRDRIEVGIGQVRRLCKAARLLANLETEAWQDPPPRHVTLGDGFSRGGGRRDVLVGIHDVLLGGRHGGSRGVFDGASGDDARRSQGPERA